MPSVRVVGCRCNQHWGCRKCAGRYWAKIRAKVEPHAGLFGDARILTLTIDRKKALASGFTAESIVRHIKKQGYIRRFLRLFGFKKAFSVLAPHKEDPEWLHWHIIVDFKDTGSWVDLRRAWRLWRDKWAVGGLDFGFKKTKKIKGERAWGYAFSYAQHQSVHLPGWIGAIVAGKGEFSRAPRAHEVYGQLRKAIAAERDTAIRDSEAEPKRRRYSGRSVSEKIARCGASSVAILNYGRRRFVGEVEINAGALMYLAKAYPEFETEVRHFRGEEGELQASQVNLSLRMGNRDADQCLAFIRGVIEDLKEFTCGLDVDVGLVKPTMYEELSEFEIDDLLSEPLQCEDTTPEGVSDVVPF